MNFKFSDLIWNDDITSIMQKFMLVLAVIFLPITTLPQRFALSSIGLVLSYYPTLIGIFIFISQLYKRKVKIEKRFIIFLVSYFIWQVICSFNGVINYEYYNLIQLEQMENLSIILLYLKNHGVLLDESIAIKVWLFGRMLKDSLRDILFGYFVSIWIMTLYRNNWKECFKNIRFGILILTIIFCCYSIIEVVYLNGNDVAAYLLKKINPFLYDPCSGRGWWPPLLWPGQLRSICEEPSFFGRIAAFNIPFLWSYFIEKLYIKYLLLYIIYVSLIFLTKARTATLLFIGEIILGSIFFVYFHKYFKQFIVICMCSIIGFFVCLSSENIYNIRTRDGINTTKSYLSNNITSAIGDSRSNIARNASAYAAANVVLKYPLFGVSEILNSAYLEDNVPDWGYESLEVQQWSSGMFNDGVLRTSFPVIIEFLRKAVSFGLFGLILFLLPPLYIIKKCFNNSKCMDYCLGCSLISLIGVMASMLSSNVFFAYYIVIGLLLVYFESENS